jgi:hypothetical protein
MKLRLAGVLLLLGFCFSFASASAVTRRDDPTPPPLIGRQKQELKEILRLNKLASAGVAVRVARIAKDIYANLLAEYPNDKTDRALSAKLHRTAGELLTLHGQAMRQSLAVLTPMQRAYVRDQMGKPDMPADLLELIVKIYALDD